ncbi:hypothetical protein EON67_08550 [archaeon]|nr:MAG: hypothetical protein EON67_08550 [archaeon]
MQALLELSASALTSMWLENKSLALGWPLQVDVNSLVRAYTAIVSPLMRTCCTVGIARPRCGCEGVGVHTQSP